MEIPVQAARLLSNRVDPTLDDIRIGYTTRYKIEPHATESASGHFFQCGAWCCFVDDRKRPSARAELANGIEEVGIVRAIEQRLHDNHPVEMELAQQLAQVIDRRRRRRERA